MNVERATRASPPPVSAGDSPPLIVSDPDAFWRLVSRLEERYGIKAKA